MFPMKSVIKDIFWPAIPSPEGIKILSVLYQIEKDQWLAPEDLLGLQRRQLQLLLKHARQTTLYYREKFNFKDDDLTEDYWKSIPIISRLDVQAKGDQLVSSNVPANHGKILRTQTSGSTGVPVKTFGTGLNQFFWRVFSLRDHIWHSRDFSAKHVFIRYMSNVPIGNGVELGDWGPITNSLFATGVAACMNIITDIETQAKWLVRQDPDYLLTYPTNVVALAVYFQAMGLQLPKLKEIRTLGEGMNDGIRDVCRTVFNVGVKDMYSAQEVGYIALQCPEYEHYHIQSESIRVEILDDEGNQCAPGQIGRVIVTPLHNFAMPLIRYEIGDYAEVGELCKCGRGLPVLKKIIGRQRNLLVTPDGKRYWPSFPASVWAEIAPIRQIQIIQKKTDLLEVKLAVSRELDMAERDKLIKVLQETFQYPFHIIISICDKIERSKNGKYEDFISEVI